MNETQYERYIYTKTPNYILFRQYGTMTYGTERLKKLITNQGKIYQEMLTQRQLV